MFLTGMLSNGLCFGTLQLADYEINDGRVHFQIVWRDPDQRQIDVYTQRCPLCCSESRNAPVTIYAWRCELVYCS